MNNLPGINSPEKSKELEWNDTEYSDGDSDPDYKPMDVKPRRPYLLSRSRSSSPDSFDLLTPTPNKSRSITRKTRPSELIQRPLPSEDDSYDDKATNGRGTGKRVRGRRNSETSLDTGESLNIEQSDLDDLASTPPTRATNTHNRRKSNASTTQNETDAIERESELDSAIESPLYSRELRNGAYSELDEEEEEEEELQQKRLSVQWPLQQTSNLELPNRLALPMNKASSPQSYLANTDLYSSKSSRSENSFKSPKSTSLRPPRGTPYPKSKPKDVPVKWSKDHWALLYSILPHGYEISPNELQTPPLIVQEAFPGFSDLELSRRIMAIERVKQKKSEHSD